MTVNPIRGGKPNKKLCDMYMLTKYTTRHAATCIYVHNVRELYSIDEEAFRKTKAKHDLWGHW